MERFPVRYGAVAQMLISSSGIAALLLTGHSGRLELVLLACFYFGIGVGGVQTVQETVWADYFGRLSLAATRSIGIPFTVAASSGGAVLGGLIYDLTKSYQFAFLLFMAALVLAAVFIGISRAPVPPESARDAQPGTVSP
ncbi:MAG: hypothetical protein NTZ05_06150 [Chloroflexi bacterium]|nr:hypothetical protein [Chloroflexota bacterium]